MTILQRFSAAAEHKALFWIKEAIVLLMLFWMGQTLVNAGHHPSGDGPHLISISQRLLGLLSSDIEHFYWAFSSLQAPHPPFAYLPNLITSALFPTQNAHIYAGLLAVYLCWDALRRMKCSLAAFIWLCAASPVWLQIDNGLIDLLAGAVVLQTSAHIWVTDRLKNRRAIILGSMDCKSSPSSTNFKKVILRLKF